MIVSLTASSTSSTARRKALDRFMTVLVASAFVIAPVVLGYFVAQRQFIQGIARTGLR